ncbi:hypothetical protein OUZ56_013724 [Daphnia magna]|uniref:Uncharacterized protein n=1 Tax=Daphnia magna TaxID=35525 RepID=A0ABQ9Z7W6_9CRUS|nr:hypothetical protein OUZ56_013724 [Daphnia magna]
MRKQWGPENTATGSPVNDDVAQMILQGVPNDEKLELNTRKMGTVMIIFLRTVSAMYSRNWNVIKAIKDKTLQPLKK